MGRMERKAMMLDSIEQVAAHSTLVEQARKATTYQISLRSAPHAINETVRLRQALKMLLRTFSFRVLRIEKLK